MRMCKKRKKRKKWWYISWKTIIKNNNKKKKELREQKQKIQNLHNDLHCSTKNLYKLVLFNSTRKQTSLCQLQYMVDI